MASSSIAAPTNDFQYFYSFEYGNEFIPVFYQLNTSGIETGGGVTSTFERFNAPDVNSTDDCGAALGVEMAFFDIRNNTHDIQVSWSTLSERNADYFEVEKSNDGVNYRFIEIVNAAGNSSETIEYSIKDYDRTPGLSYYRLRQVDFDGTTSFYGPKSVAINFELAYPNPSSNGIFHIPNDIEIKSVSVLNALGQSIDLDLEKTNIGYRLKLNSTKGIYFLNLEDINGQFIRTTLILN